MSAMNNTLIEKKVQHEVFYRAYLKVCEVNEL